MSLTLNVVIVLGLFTFNVPIIKETLGLNFIVNLSENLSLYIVSLSETRLFPNFHSNGISKQIIIYWLRIILFCKKLIMNIMIRLSEKAQVKVAMSVFSCKILIYHLTILYCVNAWNDHFHHWNSTDPFFLQTGPDSKYFHCNASDKENHYAFMSHMHKPKQGWQVIDAGFKNDSLHFHDLAFDADPYQIFHIKCDKDNNRNNYVRLYMTKKKKYLQADNYLDESSIPVFLAEGDEKNMFQVWIIVQEGNVRTERGKSTLIYNVGAELTKDAQNQKEKFILVYDETTSYCRIKRSCLVTMKAYSDVDVRALSMADWILLNNEEFYKHYKNP